MTDNRDQSDNSQRMGAASSHGAFGDRATVASSNLASYVTGVTVTYGGGETTTSPTVDNSLTNDNGAFSNFSGMQALNQNTGAAATQNASTNVAVSTRDVTPQ